MLATSAQIASTELRKPHQQRGKRIPGAELLVAVECASVVEFTDLSDQPKELVQSSITKGQPAFDFDKGKRTAQQPPAVIGLTCIQSIPCTSAPNRTSQNRFGTATSPPRYPMIFPTRPDAGR